MVAHVLVMSDIRASAVIDLGLQEYSAFSTTMVEHFYAEFNPSCAGFS